MGCPFSKRNQPSQQSSDEKSIPLSIHSREDETETKTPPTNRTTREQITKQQVILYAPIYVALRSYVSDNNEEVSFEIGDEMRLVDSSDPNRLMVHHLRTGEKGLVSISNVRIELNTPLRLAISDRAIANICLEKYGKMGAALIRFSRQSQNEYVLSINQRNQQRRANQWHYLICIDHTDHSFYFRDENSLKYRRFPRFSDLVNDSEVQRHIRITEYLPNSMTFEEELWKIPFRNVEIGQKVGSGAFGDVFRGRWLKQSETKDIALKRLKISQMSADFTREIEAMKTLTNINIVALFGITKNDVSNEVFLITEFMENGDLKSWLQSLAELPSFSTIIHFVKQISMGMSYLESCNYVHRDLACRNILVADNGRIVRIADFGLSLLLVKGQNEKTQMERVPIRWTAPEILKNGRTESIKSDVWSFGIVLIEIWLKGDRPYGDWNNFQIKEYVLEGFVHEKPSACPDDFYQTLIVPCLRLEPDQRPSFNKLRGTIRIIKKPSTGENGE